MPSSTPTTSSSHDRLAHLAADVEADERLFPLGHSPTRPASKAKPRVLERTQQQYNGKAASDYLAAVMRVDLAAALALQEKWGPASYCLIASELGVPVDLLLVRLKHHYGPRLPVMD